MFDRLVYIGESNAKIKLMDNIIINQDIMSMPLVIEDSKKTILTEITDLTNKEVTVRLLGEIIGDKFIGGVLRKPSLNSTIRSLKEEEYRLILSEKRFGNMILGVSTFYDNRTIYADTNELFSNHMCIFGNSGSGKSCGVSRVLQNVFNDKEFVPIRSNFIIFDSSGEYNNAFNSINGLNSNYNYKFITTNYNSPYKNDAEILRIPLWLLNIEDVALLLSARTHTQLSIIEKTLKLVKIFSQSDDIALNYKNYLIANAIMTILYANQNAASKRDEIFSLFTTCSTPQFSRETVVSGIGYTRKLQDCFLIDSSGEFSERVLLTEYTASFLKEEYSLYEPENTNFYNLKNLEDALNFTLISEGWLKNEKMYAEAITLKVKLHELLIGGNSKYFDYDRFVRLDQYLTSLIIKDGRKCQIINFNLEDIDDYLAKAIVKILTRLLFEFSKKIEIGSIPFNIFLEEAHRYVQKDEDQFLFGYNIFDRVAKEGRKYGLIMTLISQRPVDLSETVISQCSNFLIFKMSHPRDIEYITKMIPNITEETIEKQKGLQIGNCLAFGSGFKIPIIAKMEMPNPAPRSSNCDVVNKWTATN